MKYEKITGAAALEVREFGRKDGDQPRDEKTIETELKETLDRVKTFAEGFDTKMKAGENVSKEAKDAADEALTKLSELRGEMTELSQKLARRGGGDEPEQRKSLGESVTSHQEVKDWIAAGAKGTVGIEVKAITSAGGSAGPLIVPDRQAEIVNLPRQQMRVRDLLMPGRTEGNLIQYPKQLARTNNAAPVAEGALKPESDYTWTQADAPVRTIAHWVPVSRQAMDDIPQLESMIDGELRYGLDDVEDAELLMGDNTGQHLHGLYPQATPYAAAIELPEGFTRIDVLRLAILQVELADYAPDGMILHPTAWASIELTKTTEGAYVFANPTGIAGPQLWGRPVVSTKRIGAGNFMVGAFQLAAQIFDRMETEVRISDQDRDNFVKNMLTVRAEKRLALAVKRAAAMVKGTLPALAAA